ncbi:MAG: Transketolase [Chlamydiales bacterium]|nr:Transketolase [Chlamydiales bacterium]MCH9635367.1 Transketolase [Chlamydiales bacterium]MCH9703177.1 transketolase [Chlamydiota bacterium]
MEKSLDEEQKKILGKIANTIRGLSMDAVQKANSGHPGLPMGCAEIGAYLYGHALHHNPKNPNFANRDRLILSAGHGSMWLYSCLHLAGFNLSLEEIKNFRQLHSKTPGHPEYHETEGVEATTGPLGQGTGNAIGKALALKMLGAKFDTDEHTLFDAKVFCLCSDGDMMEGISHEASALAGHLKLDNLIFIYDANNISLDGPLAECCSEDVAKRFEAYGWEVHKVDGNNFDELHETIASARQNQSKPVMVMAHTVIGKGSPNKAGTSKAHGSPLGPDEVLATKHNLDWPEEEFYIPKAVESFFEEKLALDKRYEEQWEERFRLWAKSNPELAKQYEQMEKHHLPDLEKDLWDLELKSPLAGRAASHAVINHLAKRLPQIYGGSADLSTSDKTLIEEGGVISAGHYEGRNIKFGVREFGMATIANGLALSEMMTPFVGTFLTFSDYMRNAIRLAALSKLRVIYQFTHDSIFLGEDGPTHQSIEHYAALRAMPNLQVIRPADNNEVKMAWIAALKHEGPTAIILTRQGLPCLEQTAVAYKDGMGRGGYILQKEKSKADYTLFATGSEVSLALEVAEQLGKRGKDVRVVSMPCMELFEQQDGDYRESVIGGDLGKRVSIEAGVEQGWHKYIGLEGTAISMDRFGLSAPAGVLRDEFGFSTDAILEQI